MSSALRVIVSTVLVAAVVLAVGWHDFARPGYTPDEEFTEFAVRGITATGLPLLPSGLLYDRGLAYSYAAWLTRVLFGDGLAPARALSLICALAALLALWCAVRWVSDTVGAWLAVLLVASSIPFWTVATTARFYAPFLASYLTVLALLAPPRSIRLPAAGSQQRPSLETSLALLMLAAVCRWTHELAFTLAAIAAGCAVLAAKGERSKWMYSAAAIAAGLIVAQAGIFALHFLAPQSGETMIRRFFLWQVLNLFERPPLAAPLGLALVLTLATIIVRPALLAGARSSPLARVWLALLAIVAMWAAVTGLGNAIAYPLDLFLHIARTMPALTITTLGLLIARACGLGGVWSAGERAAHLLWLAWVVFFGVIDSGITINYLLAPVTLMLAAVAIDLAALVRHHRRNHAGLVATVVAALAAAPVATTWGVSPQATFVRARPTIVGPDSQQLREAVASASIVACTDELACLLLAGRVDRWLALDDFLRERFVVSKSTGDVGVYAGSPVAYRLGDLFTPGGATATAPLRVLAVDVFKDLPVGNSSTFLPRAMAAEGIAGVTRIETDRMRLVELNPQSR